MLRDLVLVEWEDSAQPFPGWRLPNVGDVGSDAEQGSGFFRIPTRSITRRVRLEAPA